MHPIIKEMLLPYRCQTPNDYKNSLKEIVQEIALLGLSRQGFFHKAAFYGGTALRIAHGLNRFSEDLDFTLLVPDQKFDLAPYLKGLEDELASYGLNLRVTKHLKNKNSLIDSAFLKGNTLQLLLSIDEIKITGIHPDEILKIKLEIDTNPPLP